MFAASSLYFIQFDFLKLNTLIASYEISTMEGSASNYFYYGQFSMFGGNPVLRYSGNVVNYNGQVFPYLFGILGNTSAASLTTLGSITVQGQSSFVWSTATVAMNTNLPILSAPTSVTI